MEWNRKERGMEKAVERGIEMEKRKVIKIRGKESAKGKERERERK